MADLTPDFHFSPCVCAGPRTCRNELRTGNARYVDGWETLRARVLASPPAPPAPPTPAVDELDGRLF